MNKINAISIKDKPIEKNEQDQLDVSRYIKALSKFILNSDTPITVGLQGEWGTGKTSMMCMIREELSKENVATSWVNTWEYSLFRGVKETTPAILNGLLFDLKETCGNDWPNNSDVENKIKKVGRFFGNLINQAVVNQVGVDFKSAIENNTSESILAKAEIAEVKKDISDVINQLINDPKNKYERVVFFVDDLDRINPTDAVEVLESLKNIFDLQNCIFVLAIDYDVVVKGLESKFGKKTDENEREFRSFFDKIIQVPFSMPIGTYDINNFLKEKLQNFGLKLSDEKMKTYLDVVQLSVGYNPRSLKRFLNTFSLLNTIRTLPDENDETNLDNHEQVELMLFALLGIQISYPKIFKYIAINPIYYDWDKSFAAKHNLVWEGIEEKIAKYGENELLDEEWEKVIWGFCQSDTYLKSKVFNVLELLNSLKETFKGNFNEIINDALEFAAITSIDDSQESKQNIIQIGKSKIRYNGLDAKKEQLIASNCNKQAISLWESIFEPINNNLETIGQKINFAKTVTSFYRWVEGKGGKSIQTIYCNDPSKTGTGLNINYYGYNSLFIDDMIQIASEFGWNVTREELSLSQNSKIEIVPGVWLLKEISDWELAKFGCLSCTAEFSKNQSQETVNLFFNRVTKQFIERLTN